MARPDRILLILKLLGIKAERVEEGRHPETAAGIELELSRREHAEAQRVDSRTRMVIELGLPGCIAATGIAVAANVDQFRPIFIVGAVALGISSTIAMLALSIQASRSVIATKLRLGRLALAGLCISVPLCLVTAALIKLL